MRSTSIIVVMLAAADLTHVDCFGNLNNKSSRSVSHQLQMHSADEVRRPAVYSPPLPAGSASEGKMRSSTATVDGKKGKRVRSSSSRRMAVTWIWLTRRLFDLCCWPSSMSCVMFSRMQTSYSPTRAPLGRCKPSYRHWIDCRRRRRFRFVVVVRNDYHKKMIAIS